MKTVIEEIEKFNWDKVHGSDTSQIWSCNINKIQRRQKEWRGLTEEGIYVGDEEVLGEMVNVGHRDPDKAKCQEDKELETTD